jgi:4-amino-4-deoxy-L-arabinose transferase-like glycosyltransferase
MKPKLSLRSIELLLVLALLLLSLGPRLWYIPRNLFDYDEGHWLMFGALAAQGYTPYTELFVGIAPLGLNSLRLSWLLFGSELTVRIPMMLYSLAGILAMYWLVKQQARRFPVLAGLLAATLLSFQVDYFRQSTTIMTEVPAIAMALLSLALVEKYRQSRANRWLVLAGAAAAASVLVKVFVIFLPVLAGLQLLFISGQQYQFSPEQWRPVLGRFLKLGLVWLAGVGLVFAPFLILYNPVAMYTEVLHFRFLLRQAQYVHEGLTLGQNFNAVAQSLLDNLLPLTLISLAPLLTGNLSQLRRSWWWPAWFGLAFAALAIQIPFRDRYIVLLVPPLVALTGLGGARLAAGLAQKYSPRHPYRFAAAGLALGLTVAALNCVQFFTTPPQESWLAADEVGRYASARFVHRISGPDDCIVVDDQRFAFLTGRLVPPWLSETSDARFQVGWLTSEVIAETIAKNDCVALVYISDRFGTYLPDLAAKAAKIFALELAFSDSADSRFTTVYAIPFQLQKTPAIPLNYSLGNQVLLKGVDVTPGPWAANQEISLSSYWQAIQPIPKDYKNFLCILTIPPANRGHN